MRRYHRPQYTSQEMIGSSGSKPAVSPWVYWIKTATSRYFAIALTVVDGVISYRGFIAGGMPRFESLILACFIAIFQGSVAMALVSGQPIGERFQERFFSDGGVLGAVKRGLGIFLILLGGSFYLSDILSNYVALMDGQWLPDNGVGAVWALLCFTMACALALGDELLHLVADENAMGQNMNQVKFRAQGYEAQLTARYQQRYLKSAKPVADELGSDHGARWRPRDID